MWRHQLELRRKIGEGSAVAQTSISANDNWINVQPARDWQHDAPAAEYPDIPSPEPSYVS
jgi:hypothetical protein